jgi:hypothetical protein
MVLNEFRRGKKGGKGAEVGGVLANHRRWGKYHFQSGKEGNMEQGYMHRSPVKKNQGVMCEVPYQTGKDN